MRQIANPRVTADIKGARHLPPARIVFGLFLVKLGKHLAVLASLLILGQAIDRFDAGQPAIFFLIVLSAVSYSSGKAYLTSAPRYTVNGDDCRDPRAC